MKLKYKILILVGIVIVAFIPIVAYQNKYENNKLYSEKYVIDDTSNNFIDGQYISREQAITKALEIFKNVFKIELDRNKLLENISLYNSSEGLEWSISWEESSSQYKYYCNIVAGSGDITFVGNSYSNDINIDSKNLGIEKYQKILKPIVDELGIDIINSEYYFTENNILKFIEKKGEESYVHNFSIDSKNKKINYYQRYKINNERGTYEDTRSRG